ncbi:MAG: S-layer y domain protein [Caproiciproducens sp.]|nr:S-layer y domain protein [Caproiciproducens sp.]
MKKTVFLLIIIFSLGIFGTAFAAEAPFSDVPANHWSYNAVTNLSKGGLIEGYSDGTFRGQKNVSRYEMAILIARIMTKLDKADADQKAIIGKLAKEFANELKSLNTNTSSMEPRVTALEQKAHVWFGGESRFRFFGDSPGQPGHKKLRGADQFDLRQRFKFYGDIDTNITWHAYLETNPVKFGNKETLTVDVANITMKDYWGLDSIRLGRYAVDAFGTGLFGKPTNGDAVMIKKKIGAVDFKGYVGNVKSANKADGTTTAMSKANTVTSGELGFKIDDSLSVKSSYYWSDIYTDQNSMNIASGSFKQSDGYDVAFLKKFDKIFVLGEYMGTSLSGAKGLPSNPKGWFLQISNGVPMMLLYPIANVVDVKKPGTDAWVVSYRSIDPGTLPAGIGGYSMMTANSYTKSITDSGWGNYNVYTKGTDNVNAWYFAYQKVLAKNFLLSLDYQVIDIKNKAVTSGLVGKSLDKCLLMKLEYFY